jgi:hypothetical protein
VANPEAINDAPRPSPWLACMNCERGRSFNKVHETCVDTYQFTMKTTGVTMAM